MATVEEIQAVIDALQAEPERSYGDDVLQNIIPSGKAAFQDFINALSDPIGTAESVRDIGIGLYSVLTDGDRPEEAVVEALGEYYAERYGSVDAFKNSFRTDPVGVLLDVSSVLNPGLGGAKAAGTGAIRLSDKLGADKTADLLRKAGDSKLSKVARATLIASDVGSGAGIGKVARATPAVVGEAVARAGGTVSGAGGDTPQRAFQIGREFKSPFDNRGKRFTDTMLDRGSLNVSPEQFAADVDKAASNMRSQISGQYVAGLADIDMGGTNVSGRTQTTSVTPRLNMAPEIQTKVSLPPQFNRPFFSSTFSKIGEMKRQRDAAKGEGSNAEAFEVDTSEAIDLMDNDIVEFSKSPLPDKEAAFKLRQKLDTYKFQPRSKEDGFRNELRRTLSDELKKDPKYKKLVEDFDEANKLADEIFSEFALGRDKNVSQKLRKLQTVTRNNVNTNFGRRIDLLNALNPEANYNFLDVATAQALRQDQPTGAARIGQSGSQSLGVLSVGSGVVEPSSGIFATLGQSMLTPQNVGRAAYRTGQAAQLLRPVSTPTALALPQATNLGILAERSGATSLGSGEDIEQNQELNRQLEELRRYFSGN